MMNTFKTDNGLEVSVPSEFEVSGKKYKVYANEWRANGHKRLYIRAYPPGSNKDESIACGYVNLHSGQMHLNSSPGWVARLVAGKIGVVKK